MSETHGSPEPRAEKGRPRDLGPVNGHPVGNVPAGVVPSVKCAATNRAGEPCGRWAIVGGSVCPTHGGSAPQTKEAAQRRIQSLVPLALQVQEDILLDDQAPAAVRARVADSVLDRGGHKEADVVVSVDATAQTNARLDGAIERALAARYPDAIDVELATEELEPEA